MQKIHLKRIWAMMLRHLFVWPRDLNNLVDCFWWGTFDLVIWGMTSVYVGHQTNSSFVGFIVGGLILWMILSRSQQETGIEYIKESWDRNMMNIVSSPITPVEHMLALTLLSLFKLTITISWMAILAHILFSFNIFRFGWAFLPFAASLLLTGWASGLLINGLIVQYGNRIESFSWMLVWVIQPFSGVYYPTSSMPGWMQNVANWLPTSYIFDGMRTVLSSGNLDTNKLLISFALNAVYLVLGIYYFAYGYRKALQSGMILKLS
jgi:ABC-2 type transport system permease protein